MAYLKVLNLQCREPGCKARATRELWAEDFASLGVYCTRHASPKLVEVSQREGAAKAGDDLEKRRVAKA